MTYIETIIAVVTFVLSIAGILMKTERDKTRIEMRVGYLEKESEIVKSQIVTIDTNIMNQLQSITLNLSKIDEKMSYFAETVKRHENKLDTFDEKLRS